MADKTIEIRIIEGAEPIVQLTSALFDLLNDGAFTALVGVAEVNVLEFVTRARRGELIDRRECGAIGLDREIAGQANPGKLTSK